MSYLSNLTNDNYNNTRLLFGNEELFSGHNIEKYNVDSNKLQQNSNNIPYKYNHGNSMFNHQNNNSNSTVLFNQNSIFLPFNYNDNSIGSNNDKSIKGDFTLIGTKLFM